MYWQKWLLYVSCYRLLLIVSFVHLCKYHTRQKQEVKFQANFDFLDTFSVRSSILRHQNVIFKAKIGDAYM